MSARPPLSIPADRKLVSFSEISSWTRCRKQHYFTYTRKIEPRYARRAPLIGSCGHAVIEALYQKRNLAQAATQWAVEQTEGKELFDEEVAEFHDMADLCTQLVERFRDHYAQGEYQIVEVEKEFLVPVRGTRTLILGYIDALVEDCQNRLWMMETKFPQETFRTEQDVELDAQLGIYHGALRKLKYPVVGIIYNQILAKLPKEPSLNKNGTMSRSDLRTDWDTYRAALLRNNLDPDDYWEMREKLEKKEFFRRYFIHRGDVERKNFQADLERRVYAMMKDKHVFMTENRFNCGMCSYRELCLSDLHGADTEFIISHAFVPRPQKVRDDLIELSIPEIPAV